MTAIGRKILGYEFTWIDGSAIDTLCIVSSNSQSKSVSSQTDLCLPCQRSIYFFISCIFIYSMVFPGDDMFGNFIQSLYIAFIWLSLPGSIAAVVISRKYWRIDTTMSLSPTVPWPGTTLLSPHRLRIRSKTCIHWETFAPLSSFNTGLIRLKTKSPVNNTLWFVR